MGILNYLTYFERKVVWFLKTVGKVLIFIKKKILMISLIMVKLKIFYFFFNNVYGNTKRLE